MRNTALTLRPLSGHTGMEILDVDLSADLPEHVYEEIRAALNEWGAVFFRDQDLTPAQQLAFARRFGTVYRDPNPTNMKGVSGHPEIQAVVREPDQPRNVGGFWHMDQSFQQHPACFSLLYARELPPLGGDTLYAHLGAAYDALSPGLRATLEPLSCVHIRYLSDNRDINPAAASFSVEDYVESRKKYAGIEATHPVIATHPETGRKLLFFSPVYCDRFEGWTREDSLPLMQHLTEVMSKPEFTGRFRWEEGSLALWDNRAVVHYALDDYAGHRRVMHRIIVNGPWFAARGKAAA